ncbi:MAG: hypothetical protein KBC62_01685 [Candidatus Pacebacteria bacterium]|nr:hypothetical protein [Candidatus Paceibacterota bacterium]
MNNFKSSGPGGLRGRRDFIGGRPKSDANYGPKKSFDKKPGFGGKGGFRGGDRGADRGGFKGSRDGERREVTMHKATCSTCGKPCEVPFRPDGSKPVLCSECFGKNRSDDRNGVERRGGFSNDRPKRDFDTPRPPRGPSPEMVALQQQVASLEATVNEILSLVKGNVTPKAKMTEKETVKKVVAKKVAKKVTKKVAKKVTKKKK